MGDKKSKGAARNEKASSASFPLAGYAGLPAMRDEMDRMMQQFFGTDWLSRMGPMPSVWQRLMGEGVQMPFAALMNAPKADMTESANEYEVSVELPGLDEKDIELSLTDSALVLKGEKKAEKETKEKDYHFTERSYGSIRRHFPLPPGVDRDAMKATFKKGVLHVKLPKTGEAKTTPRRIEVTAG